jgi:osmotically-inducible protein OsmY
MHKHAWINGTYVNLIVDDGVVEIWGFVDSADQQRAVRVLVEETEGVTRVIDKITIGSPYRGGI